MKRNQSRPHPLEVQAFDDGLRDKFVAMLSQSSGRDAVRAAQKRIKRRSDRSPKGVIPTPHKVEERTGFRVITNTRRRQSPVVTYLSTLALAITSGLLIGMALT